MTSASVSATGTVAGCLSSDAQDEWVYIGGYVVVNETDSQRTFQLGITDSGTPVQYSWSVEVPAHSQKTVSSATDSRSDYLVGAAVDNEEVVVDSRELVEPGAECVVPIIRLIDLQELSISGNGYQDCPSELSNASESGTNSSN